MYLYSQNNLFLNISFIQSFHFFSVKSAKNLYNIRQKYENSLTTLKPKV